MRLPRRVVFALLPAILLGCDHAPDVAKPTRPSQSVADPGTALFACGRWMSGVPSTEIASFDLEVTDLDARAAIERAGGKILHEYYVPMIRARLPVSAVPGLWSSRAIGAAFEVPAGKPPEFNGCIITTMAASDADLSFFQSVGVRLWPGANAGGHTTIATIPDGVVPAILSHPGVQAVYRTSTVCVAD